MDTDFNAEAQRWRQARRLCYGVEREQNSGVFALKPELNF